MVKRQKEKQYQSARENRTNQQLRASSNGGTRTATTTTSIADGSNSNSNQPQHSSTILPFTHCALSLVPYEIPICTNDGIIFDQNALIQFIIHNKIDPISGIPMTTSSINQHYIVLNIDQNEEGQWQCPILTKPFNDRSKVIAIIQHDDDGDDEKKKKKKTNDKEQQQQQQQQQRRANVYSYEAYYELNIKTKNYIDLISGNKFHPKNDIIIIYDPYNVEFNQKRNSINSLLNHNNNNNIQHRTQQRDAVVSKNNIINNHNNNNNNNVKHSVTATRVMETLRKHQANEMKEMNAIKKLKRDESLDNTTTTNDQPGIVRYYNKKDGQPLKVLVQDVTGVQYTIGRNGTSSSLTSTISNVSDTNSIREATNNEIIQSLCNVMKTKLKKKGYIKLYTNHGILTLELHCDIVPYTCMNFIELCRNQRYIDTIFHRLIPNFMIQGGGYKSKKTSKRETNSNDDTNATTNNNNANNIEECIWGGSFDDEFDDRLKHIGSGIVSMANSGPNTNQQQFFITFTSCTHLDHKHSIFGEIIDGKDILQKWEQYPVDHKDRPIDEIKIIKTEIIVDPVLEAREFEQKRIEKLIAMREANNDIKTLRSTSNDASTLQKKAIATPKVGQYLQQTLTTQTGKESIEKDDKVNDISMSKNLNTPSFASSQNTKPTFGNFSGW